MSSFSHCRTYNAPCLLVFWPYLFWYHDDSGADARTFKLSHLETRTPDVNASRLTDIKKLLLTYISSIMYPSDQVLFEDDKIDPALGGHVEEVPSPPSAITKQQIVVHASDGGHTKLSNVRWVLNTDLDWSFLTDTAREALVHIRRPDFAGP